MEVRYLPNSDSYQRMTTGELRSVFAFEKLFLPGAITMVYCDTDRAIVGAAVPQRDTLKLQATKKEMAAEFFTERRELGIVNIGDNGTVRADGKEYTLSHNDMLYVGRGVRSIEFCGAGASHNPAFYFVSFPAHTAYPVTLVPFAAAEKTRLGTDENANKRTINKYIHAGGAKSCQLVMGLTELETGNVWNTMPPHTHMRRMEIYLYYGMDDDTVVVHMMGKPDETRSLILRNQQAVISPSWSIHCGTATKSYSFVWAMGGENQEFSDMDAVSLRDLH